MPPFMALPPLSTGIHGSHAYACLANILQCSSPTPSIHLPTLLPPLDVWTDKRRAQGTAPPPRVRFCQRMGGRQGGRWASLILSSTNVVTNNSFETLGREDLGEQEEAGRRAHFSGRRRHYHWLHAPLSHPGRQTLRARFREGRARAGGRRLAISVFSVSCLLDKTWTTNLNATGETASSYCWLL